MGNDTFKTTIPLVRIGEPCPAGAHRHTSSMHQTECDIRREAGIADQPQTSAQSIENRMEDYGGGRHVGWWSENHIGHRHLLIEVESQSVIFSCCEGERAERRITFAVGREKAAGIAKALAGALGMECADAK